jgi:hypothetical protein
MNGNAIYAGYLTMLAVLAGCPGTPVNAGSICFLSFLEKFSCLLPCYVGRLAIHSEWLCLLAGFYDGNAGLLCCVSTVSVLAGY